MLAGTALAGKPLQTITLQQVLALNPQPAAVRNLTLGNLLVADSAIGQVTIGALALGKTPINGLGAEAASIETQLQAWCTGVAGAANCSLASIGNQSLFALSLAGAPINGLPINGLPINGLPINGLPINGLPINGLNLSASPINGLPINGLPINGLPINGLPAVTLATVVDCTKAGVNCLSSQTLGQAAALGGIKSTATILDLLRILLADGSPVQNTLTLGDVIGLLIKSADVPWETLPPRLLSVFDTSRPIAHMNANFTLQGTGQGTGNATVKVTLPAGFDFKPGSAQLQIGGPPSAGIGDPTIDTQANTLTWTVPNVPFNTPSTISFDTWSGSSVGPTQATASVTSGGFTGSGTVPFSVTDGFDNNTPATATTISPDTNVEMSAIASAGEVDYYKIPMPPAGTRLLVHLTNLPADYDLALYSPTTTSVRTGTSAVPGPPLQDGTIADQSLSLQNGGSNTQLTPTALQDIPDPGIPVVQVSANRGTDDEDVGMVSPGGGGFATIAVFGYNGASSPEPYSLRVTTQAPPGINCSPRTLTGGTAGTVPSITSLPSNLNTLILVNEKRIGATYGAAAETSVVSSLTRLAGDATLGVSGAVIPVEGLAQAQYTAWDANPCNVNAANAVANAIANEIAAVKAQPPEPQVRRLRRRRRPDPVLPDPRSLADRERERLRRHVQQQRVLRRARKRRPAHRQPVPRHPARSRERPAALHPRPRRRPPRRDASADRQRRHELRELERDAPQLHGVRLRLRLRQRRKPARRAAASVDPRGTLGEEPDRHDHPVRARDVLVEERPPQRGIPDARPGGDQRLERPLRQHARPDGKRRPPFGLRADGDTRLLRRHLPHDGLPRRLPDDRRDHRDARCRLGRSISPAPVRASWAIPASASATRTASPSPKS